MIVMHFDIDDRNFDFDIANGIFKQLKENYPEETFVALPDYINLKKNIDLEYLIYYRDTLNEILWKKEKGLC